MRGMIELHVRSLLETVDSLPGNVFAFSLIRSNFLDFRMVGVNRNVTSHTEARAGNCRVRSLVHACMAEDTLKLIRKVNFVGELNRLNRRRTNIKKFAHGAAR